MSRSSTGAGLPSEYTLKMALSHDIQAGGGLLIKYPPQVQVVEGETLSVTVDASPYSAGLVLDSPSIDLSARQMLFMDNNFPTDLIVDPSGTQELTITITGLQNPMNNEASTSFEIITFNRKENVLYFIDQVVSGLSIENVCNHPCDTCLSTNPNYCTSCFADTQFKYVEKGTCLPKCSPGLFLDEADLKCKDCDSECLTCEGTRH